MPQLLQCQHHQAGSMDSHAHGEATSRLSGRESSDRRGVWWVVRQALSKLTVEPALLLYTVGKGLGFVLEERMWLEKTCLFNLHYSEAVCETLSSGQHPKEQIAVQRQMALYHMYLQLLTHVPAVPFVLLLGAWSDIRGRRLPVVLPLLGITLKVLGLVANSWWWSLPPEYLLLSSVPMALTGGIPAFVMAFNAYISAATGNRERATRFSLIMVILAVGGMTGKGVALILFHQGGYLAIFATQASFTAAATIYCLVFLKDRPEGAAGQVPSQSPTAASGFGATIKRRLLVALREREGGRRRLVIGYTLILWLLLYSVESYSYGFLYTRKIFQWDYKTYTSWSIVDEIFSLVGSVLVMPLMSYWGGAKDAMLGLVGAISMVFTHTLLATASRPWVFYVASAAGSCAGMVGSSTRAAVSKLVPGEELGAVFAVLAVGKTIVPILSSMTFSAIYIFSVEGFPGAVFALTAVGGVIIALFFVWVLTSPSSGQDQPGFTNIKQT